MQMEATIKAILSALARIDDGKLALILDEGIYSDRAVQSFVEVSNPHYRAQSRRSGGALHLEIYAADLKAARLQIGNALGDLLMCALREQ